MCRKEILTALFFIFFLSASIIAVADDNKTDNSVLEQNILQYPLNYREKPMSYADRQPGELEKPRGYSEFPPGYASPTRNFHEKNPNVLDEPRNFEANPPNFVEKDSHPSANSAATLRIATEELAAANNDPGKRIDVTTHPGADNAEKLRLASISEAVKKLEKKKQDSK